MGILDTLVNAGRGVASGAQALPPGAPQPGGHASVYDALNAALAPPQQGQTQAEKPMTLFNMIDTSALDKIPNMGLGPQQPAQKPAEDGNVSSAQQQQFVKDVYPHAADAAKQLGIDPSVLVAQAGLETGWGQSFPKNADGSSSFNYFSIKPGSKWSGPTTVPTTTHEQDAQGTAHTENDAFRSYPDAASSFKDYVSFLKSNPRYADVLKNAPGQDALSYATALQKAGYATDVQYGHKVAATAHTVSALSKQ